MVNSNFLLKKNSNPEVRDKKKDRARDEDVEEGIRPKQSSSDIPFMTAEEVRVFLFFCFYMGVFLVWIFVFFVLEVSSNFSVSLVPLSFLTPHLRITEPQLS